MSPELPRLEFYLWLLINRRINQKEFNSLVHKESNRNTRKGV